MDIVVIEDDYLQIEPIKAGLRQHFGEETTIEIIRSEWDFYTWLGRQHSSECLPDVVVMDMMVWRYRGREGISSKANKEKYAGLRCRRHLHKKKLTKHIPVVFFSVLRPSELRSRAKLETPLTKFVSKRDSMTSLYETIELLLCAKHTA